MTAFGQFDFGTEDTIEVNQDVDSFAAPIEIDEAEFKLCEIVPNHGGEGFFSLRPYQDECVEAVFESWNHYQSTLVVKPTGSGKTVTMAEVAIRWPEHLGRVLVIAHREELIDQSAEKIGLHLAEENIGIEMGERREVHGMYGRKSKVLVASVQTLAREKRRSKFNPMDFGALFIDECVTADSLIQTHIGPKCMAYVNEGDFVYSFDGTSVVLAPVTKKWATQGRQVVQVTLACGKQLRCTPNHLIATDDGWHAAEELTPAMSVRVLGNMTSRSSRFERVESVLPLLTETVYDITVEGTHCFFANGILVHNCHHAPSKSYREVIKYFLRNPQLRILGVTATPERHDEKAMGDIFQNVSYQMDIVEGIEEGWLVDIEQKLVVVEGLDFSKCRITAGDLNEKDLVAAMMGGTAEKIESVDGHMTDLQREQIEQQEKMLHAVVTPTIKEAQGRPTIVFCVTKAHAERICEIFNRHPGVRAEFVTDDTHKEDRKSIFQRFRSGQTQILVNVGIATEGFDARVDVVVVARPTKSKSLYLQMCGRSVRPLPRTVEDYPTAAERRESIRNSNKPCATILDFVGAAGKHNICTLTDVLGGNYEEDVIAAAKAELLNGSTEIVSELLKKTKQELEEAKRKFQQEKAERDRVAKEKAEQERLERAAEHQRREKIRAEVQYRTESVSLRGNVMPEQIGVGQIRGGATDNQVKFLIRLGVTHETACKYTRGQAGAVIDKLVSKTGADHIVQFGKYMGHSLGKLPSHYVDWMVQNMTGPQNEKLIQNIKLMRSEAGQMESFVRGQQASQEQLPF